MYTCMPPHMSLDHTNHFINILQPFFSRPHRKRDRGRYGRATDFLPMFENCNLQPNLFSKDHCGKREGRKVTESIVARSCNLDWPNTGMKKWQLPDTQKSWHQVGPTCFDGRHLSFNPETHCIPYVQPGVRYWSPWHGCVRATYTHSLRTSFLPHSG